MCYTTDEYVKPKTEVTYSAQFAYGSDGYRTNCNNIPVSGYNSSIDEILNTELRRYLYLVLPYPNSSNKVVKSSNYYDIKSLTIQR